MVMGLRNGREVLSDSPANSDMAINIENSCVSLSQGRNLYKGKLKATPPEDLQLQADSFSMDCSEIIETFISEFHAKSMSKSVIGERNLSGKNMQAEVDNDCAKSEKLEKDTTESQRLESISLSLEDQNRNSLPVSLLFALRPCSLCISIKESCFLPFVSSLHSS